jgi:hypothetical protein
VAQWRRRKSRSMSSTWSSSKWASLRRSGVGWPDSMPAGDYWRAAFLSLSVAALALVACDPRFECSSSQQCDAGRVCMRIHPTEKDDGTRCVVPCTQWTNGPSAECADAGLTTQCYCPDSPAGARCRIVEDPENTLGTYYCSEFRAPSR